MGRSIPIRHDVAYGKKKEDAHPLKDGQADILVTILGVHGMDRAFAEVAQIYSSRIDELEEGMKVFCQASIAERMYRDRDGAWGPGSQLVVRVSRNTSEKYAQKCPFWAFYWDWSHPDNVRMAVKNPDEVVGEQSREAVASLEAEGIELVERVEALASNDERLNNNTLVVVSALELLLSEEDKSRIEEREAAARIAMTSLRRSLAILERPAGFQEEARVKMSPVIDRLRATIKKMPAPAGKGNGSSSKEEDGHLKVTIADLVGDLSSQLVAPEVQPEVASPELVPA